MFVRDYTVTPANGREYRYVKVLESYRENGEVCQRTLVNFGNVSHWPLAKVDELIHKLANCFQLEAPQTFFDAELDLGLQYGTHLVLDRLWQELDLSRLLRAHLRSTKLEFDAVPYLKAMIFHRLLEPASKRQCHQTWLARQYLPEVTGRELHLHQFYRALEALARIKDPLEASLHQRLVNLFNRELSLVFFDMTSTYFEGDECPLAEWGYSRDHRPDRPQINIALLVDEAGLPIAHQVVKGNVLDQQTVAPVLREMRERFQIDRCVFVGDRGMLPEGKQAEVVEQGYQYLTALRLNNDRIAEWVMEQLPGRLQFERVKDNLWVYEAPRPLGEGYAKVRQRKDAQARSRAKGEGKPAPGRPTREPRFIAVYNPRRGHEEKQGRRAKLREALATLRELPAEIRAGRKVLRGEEKLAAVGKRLGSSKRYFELNIEGEDQIRCSLQRQVIREVRRREGLQILVTDMERESAAEVALSYRMLSQIEDAFKDIKGFLRLRPVRHWAEDRVRGHAAVCVLGYLLECWLEKRKLAPLELTAQQALTTLSALQAVRIELAEETLLRPMRMRPEYQPILKLFGLTQLPPLLVEAP